MQIRCFRCSWSFAIKKDEIAFALQALEESDGSHYDVRCPRCRHTNRISIEQLRRATPGQARASTEPSGQPAEDTPAEPSEASEDAA